MTERPLWLRKTAHQLVAQWTARKSPSQWCEDSAQRDSLVRHLCLELIFAIALRVPDPAIRAELLALHHKASQPRAPLRRNSEILSLEGCCVRERLIECLVALIGAAIVAPGVIWWMLTIAAVIRGTLP